LGAGLARRAARGVPGMCLSREPEARTVSLSARTGRSSTLRSSDEIAAPLMEGRPAAKQLGSVATPRAIAPARIRRMNSLTGLVVGCSIYKLTW